MNVGSFRQMNPITFDTLEGTRRLRNAGFDEIQADAVIRLMSHAQEKLVTQEHFDHRIDGLEKNLTIRLGSLMAVAVALMAALAKLL